MSIFVPITLFGWPLLVLALFSVMSAPRAVGWAFVGAWLFLPMAGYPIPGLPDYTKTSVAGYSALLGLAVFRPALLMAVRPKWIDVPVVVLCLVPMASSVTNGLGIYDGLSAVVGSVATYGVPYVCGRAVYRGWADLSELARVFVLGGLIYVPFCLFEVRMSPQLHNMVYGFSQHSFGQTVRGGGWRPMVFMQHGLAVGLWMAVSSIAGYWMWRQGVLRQFFGVKGGWQVLLLVGTTVLCKSTGATGLMVLIIGLLELGRRVGGRWILLGLLLSSPMFLAGRIAGVWDGRFLVDMSSKNLSADRAQSLEFRLDNEDILMAKAMQQPVFGWGGWGRNRVFNDEGRDITVTDGMWIIVLGVNGVVGLAAFYGTILGGAVVWVWRMKRELWGPENAAGVALMCVTAVYAIDCVPNAMLNPVFLLVGAAMVGASSFGGSTATPVIPFVPSKRLTSRGLAGGVARAEPLSGRSAIE